MHETQSSVLAWRIPGTEEPAGLPVYGVAQSQTRLTRLSSSSKHIQTEFLTLVTFKLSFLI